MGSKRKYHVITFRSDLTGREIALAHYEVKKEGNKEKAYNITTYGNEALLNPKYVVEVKKISGKDAKEAYKEIVEVAQDYGVVNKSGKYRVHEVKDNPYMWQSKKCSRLIHEGDYIISESDSNQDELEKIIRKIYRRFRKRDKGEEESA